MECTFVSLNVIKFVQKQLHFVWTKCDQSTINRNRLSFFSTSFSLSPNHFSVACIITHTHTQKNHTMKVHFDLKYVKQLNCELIYLLKYFVVNFECFCLSMVFVVQHRTVCAPFHGIFFFKSLVFNSIWSLFNIFIAISFFSLIFSLVVASVDLLGAVTLSEPLIDGVHLIWQSIGLIHWKNFLASTRDTKCRTKHTERLKKKNKKKKFRRQLQWK